MVGLGYVGLPLLVEFAKNKLKVSGFDINKDKINSLKNNIDPCEQINQKTLEKLKIHFDDNPAIIKKANFIIIAVPTPIDQNKKPDLRFLESSSAIVGRNLNKGSIVVYESTVYPGVTEEICLPILEKNSKLKCGRDFFIGYSPERVNPGDLEHTIEKITKIVSCMDPAKLEIIARVYSTAIKAGVFRAKNIKTAEAAKVIENIQRDLNIALMNELSLIFARLGISSHDVIEAAGTKWNFHKYHPGLVGGHCIGVDPYYLVHKAQDLGYEPEVLLAGRRVNEFMSRFVAESMIKMLIKSNKCFNGAKILIMGLTFKENINDIRNSKATDIIKYLQEYNIDVIACEPNVPPKIVKEEFGIDNLSWDKISQVDGVILFNGHKKFQKISVHKLRQKINGIPILFDIKNYFKKSDLEKNKFVYQCL